MPGTRALLALDTVSAQQLSAQFGLQPLQLSGDGRGGPEQTVRGAGNGPGLGKLYERV
ncbi:MAG TPA: hypothetical protein VNH84_14635 [Candidatus Saccharimonadales bacterium]|nr:hypothetical protein [Candidatus Saccharimonadales bacterium]